MKGVGQVNAEMAERYFALFVNRLAYTLQSHKPGTNGKHYYYRPKQDRRLSPPDHSRAFERSANRWSLRSESDDAALQVGGN